MFFLLARIQGNWGHWTCYLITSKHTSSGKLCGDDKGMAHKFERKTEAQFHRESENKSTWVPNH